MNATQVLATLESLGTEQNRKTFARHGAVPPCFGVSFAHLEKLRKQIKRDQALAEALWQTGNFDACNLATLIADPLAMSAADLDRWSANVNNRCLAEMFGRKILACSVLGKQKAERWVKAKNEYLAECAFVALAVRAMDDPSEPDGYYEKWLRDIEAGIHRAPNRARHGMNQFLIAIGTRNARLRKLALAAAGRIGKVEVDHGDTACKTPDAAAYILKVAARAAGKK
jgi:3-methyladenine DNA glycosylase AlkD